MIIGFSGRKRSGKSTAAEACVGLGFEPLAFADPLKYAVRFFMAKAGLSLGRRAYYERDAKEEVIPQLGRSFRQMAQTLGTEWGRECVHPDFWVILARETLNDLIGQGEDVVVEDVRFENEAALIRELGGLVVHVRRPGLAADDEHASEVGIVVCDGDVVIDNCSSADVFRSAVVEVVNRFAGAADR